MTNNPITHSPNKLKIGIFCTNGRGTAQHTLVPEANQQDWPLSLLAARAVDEAGYEAIVPFARWKGYLKDRPDHVSAYALDPFTWAAGIAQATRSEEHTSELQSLMRTSYAVLCLKKKII